MKKKVKMTCILKSGAQITETIKIPKKNTKAFYTINEMRNSIEKSLGSSEPMVSNITFGRATILVSEIAAITFKEN